ncbi:hypothetical protein TNCV_1048951 [Trichonephila clavipes]|nr:hypothetical protein TNCV_1048951 [Trichonephila clavipes]
MQKVSAVVRKNKLQTIAESVGISSDICQWILTKDLNRHRVRQHIVPRTLNEGPSVDEVKSASQAGLKGMDKNIFHKCFDDLPKRWQ